MSGILGIWNLDGRPVDASLLADLSAILAHRGPDADGRWISGSVALAARVLRTTPEAATETQPLVHPSGIVVVFDGRLDDRDELLAALRSSAPVSAASPDAALVLAAYQAFGERFPDRLTGDFALGLFDSARERLVLARDPIGIKPLYYCRARDTFLFASEVKALLAHPAVEHRPNDDLLADFLMGRVRDGEGMTFFEGVSSVRPAHTLTVAAGRLVTRRYWDFDPSRRVRLASFPEYAEAFREHFERAVRRRLRSAQPVAVSVSGGLDSSSIFCLAETLARRNPADLPRVRGVSYRTPAGTPSDETAFLREIEREYAVAIERVPMQPLGLLNGSREAVWHVEAPFVDEQWNTTAALLRTVRHLGARVLVTGHWADQVLFDQAYLVDLVWRLAWRRARADLAEFGRWLTDVDPAYFRHRFALDLVKYSVPGLLLPTLRRLRREPARPWYAEAFRRRARRPDLGRVVGPRRGTAHARALYDEARSSHHVLCMEWNDKVAARHGLEMRLPFLDRDLLSFLMAIPGEMQTWQGVPKALLRAAMHGVLPEAIARRTWKADFTHLVNEGMRRDLPEAIRVFECGGMAASLGYLKADVLRRELGRLQNGLSGPTSEAAWSLSDLLGLELWLEVFFGNGDNGHGRRAAAGDTAPATLGGAR
jgi:asparagine synthase (glutamine-hydrolysing)